MTEKQRQKWNWMRAALTDISGADTPDKLRKSSRSEYGLSYDEALEMAYENIQAVA